jgi:hypothetical protein
MVGMRMWIEKTVTLKQGEKTFTDTRVVKEQEYEGCSAKSKEI